MRQLVIGLLIFIGLLTVVSLSGPARSDGHTIREINEQIWIPFVRSYAEGNGDLHASLYGSDIVRVNRDNVSSGKAYIERMRAYVDGLRDRGGRAIAFRFTERTSNEDAAYETGVFRLMRNNGTAAYGQFEVIIRKEDGRWKLTFDRGHTNKP